MKYCIEDVWDVRLGSMLTPENLAQGSTVNRFRGASGMSNWEIVKANKSLTNSDGSWNIPALFRFTKQRAQQIKPGRMSPRQRNFRRFSRLFGYGDAEADWLTFAAYLANNQYDLKYISCYHLQEQFQASYRATYERQKQTQARMFSRWSGLNHESLLRLCHDEILWSNSARVGMCPTTSDTSQIQTLVQFHPPYDTLSYHFCERRWTQQQIIKLFITGMKTSRLGDRDFQHIQSDLAVDYLRRVRETKTKGANILVYGPPGTGKTEFVRWLCGKAGFTPYVAMSPQNNQSGAALKHAMASERFLNHYAEGVLVVDEAEDVFVNTNYSGWLTPDAKRVAKSKLNDFLETNRAPIIWVCNQRHVIDPSVRRRCDIVIEIDKLPESVRRRIVQRHTHGLSVPTEWKQKLARNNDLTAADIGSACRVAKLAGRKGAAAQSAVEEVLRGKLKERERPTKVLRPERAVVDYRLEYINTDADLSAVLSAFQRGRSGRFCFYGPAGTGKTEFVRQTANRIDKPLIEKPASALLDMYVGQTEKRIAAAFAEAADQDGILLIDEADSFLRNREGARQTWEVSQVNELLQQMENHDGILVCCTNLIDGIDPAAFRRFDMKIKFDYMRNQQVIAMLENAAGPIPTDQQRRVSKLRCCTPGDFAAALRRFEFLNTTPTVEAVLDQLDNEVGFKPENRSNRIGF